LTAKRGGNVKYFKTLGVAITASILFTAMTGPTTSQATVLCSDHSQQSNIPCSKPFPYNTSFLITMFPGSAEIENGLGKVTCKRSSMPGNLSRNGYGRAYIMLSSLNFSECSGCSIGLIEPGALEVEWLGETQYLNYWGNGDVYGSSQRLQLVCGGISCIYTTDYLGTLPSGGFPVINVSAKLKYLSGNEWCKFGSATWRGSYEIVYPNPVYVERSY
jgi:hypothetical protein